MLATIANGNVHGTVYLVSSSRVGGGSRWGLVILYSENCAPRGEWIGKSNVTND